jgi:hypothetical protein
MIFLPVEEAFCQIRIPSTGVVSKLFSDWVYDEGVKKLGLKTLSKEIWYVTYVLEY